MSVLTQHPSPSDQEALLMYSSASYQISPLPHHFSYSNHPPPSSSPINHAKKHPVLCHNCHTLAPTPSKSPNICRPFGCRLVGHCIAYEWAIHATNTELLSAEHFPNAVKLLSKRHQTTLKTPSNHPRNAIKPPSKRHQTILETPPKSFS